MRFYATAFAFFVAFALSAAVAEDLTTLTGRTYTNANVSRVDGDGITVLYPGGGSKIAFTNLPPEIQKKYGYDPEKAAAIAAKQEKIKKLGRLGLVYRLSDLEEAKAEAKKTGQPIAFLASDIKSVQSSADPRRKGTAAATIHVFEGLRKVAVIVFSDYTTENHTEPPLVDSALHPPEDVHYTAPKVVITDADVTKVIAVVAYHDDAAERQKRLVAATGKIQAERKEPSSAPKP
jgi:hypothetical protein